MIRNFCAAVLFLHGTAASANPLPSAARPHPAPRAVAVAPEVRQLLPFLRALSMIEHGRARQSVTVLQLGDSHTAKDEFTAGMRDSLQARFGNGGRGVLPPGIPHDYYRPHGVQVSADGWQRVRASDPDAGGVFGLTLLRQHADGAATMTYAVDAPEDLQRVAVEVMLQPGGGIVDAAIDGAPVGALNTAQPGARAYWWHLARAHEGHALVLRARGNGPVDIMAVNLTRARPGVVYANLGWVGAQVSVLAHATPSVVAQDLAELRPALVALAFGTNEGFKDSLDPAEYAAVYAEIAGRVTPPGGSLMIIGPADGNRRAGSGAGSAVCGADGAWVVPPMLGVVRGIETRLAAQHGWFFWDWEKAMGGQCTMAAWASAMPPLAFADHVHLRDEGYRQTASRLYDAIMQAWAKFALLPVRP